MISGKCCDVVLINFICVASFMRKMKAKVFENNYKEKKNNNITNKQTVLPSIKLHPLLPNTSRSPTLVAHPTKGSVKKLRNKVNHTVPGKPRR